jgi:hypothetical protein
LKVLEENMVLTQVFLAVCLQEVRRETGRLCCEMGVQPEKLICVGVHDVSLDPYQV